MSKYIEVSGSLYKSEPDTSRDGCTGCAFERDNYGCGLANAQVDCTEILWKLAPVADQPCTTTPVVAHEVPDVSVKPSNPKDMIGIRKAPMSCLPMGVVAELGTALLEGAAKYGKFNFRGVGVRSSVYFDATMRHLIAYWEGEDTDPDSGMSHLTKAMASLAVWRDAQIQGKCTDDRPPRSVPFYPELNDLAGKILDRHADKSPKHWTISD